VFRPDDTIVAVATPQGKGSLGIVRISGPEALALAKGLLDHPEQLKPRYATLAKIIDHIQAPEPSGIDQVIATFFPRPRSYTGEDVVELSAHGSPVLLERIVGLALLQGARLAEPGEFTLRAFMNGRLDLVQAEAVGDLVNAVTPLQARMAFDQLEGTMTGLIASLDVKLFDLIARLEASLDFPEEGYHFIKTREVVQSVEELLKQVRELLSGAASGRLIREGCQIVILGKPNVGKSTLFNYLVGSDRAIVTSEAGTTRDLITEVIDLDGLAVTLVDTAGIRTAEGSVEAEGVSRARQAIGVAAAVVVVLDQSRVLGPEDWAVLEETAKMPRVMVLNKADCSRSWSSDSLLGGDRVVSLSALTGDGVWVLRETLREILVGIDLLRDTPRIANIRHINLLERAATALESAKSAANEAAGEEFILADLDRARTALEELTGKRTSDDVLQHIFERFCIGK